MASSANPTRDDFAAHLNESLGGEDQGFEGRVFYWSTVKIYVCYSG